MPHSPMIIAAGKGMSAEAPSVQGVEGKGAKFFEEVCSTPYMAALAHNTGGALAGM